MSRWPPCRRLSFFSQFSLPLSFVFTDVVSSGGNGSPSLLVTSCIFLSVARGISGSVSSCQETPHCGCKPCKFDVNSSWTFSHCSGFRSQCGVSWQLLTLPEIPRDLAAAGFAHWPAARCLFTSRQQLRKHTIFTVPWIDGDGTVRTLSRDGMKELVVPDQLQQEVTMAPIRC